VKVGGDPTLSCCLLGNLLCPFWSIAATATKLARSVPLIIDEDRAASSGPPVPASLRLAFYADVAGTVSMQSRSAFASLRSCVSKPSVNQQ
jgi:hypothetical protein